MTFFIFLLAKILQIGDAALTVEIADTNETRTQGLMYRKSLSENEGMLFICERPQKVNFWMKNTLIPLSVGFFDEQKVLFQIADMVPPPPGATTFPVTTSEKPMLYALEVNLGWFAKHKIQPGMKFSLESK